MMTLDPVDGERGAMVNTASAAATDGQIGQAAYSAAKAAIVGMTLTIARDLSREAIRINTIQPGIFHTPAMARATPQMLESLGSMVPFPQRLGHADEYASLALEMIRNGYSTERPCAWTAPSVCSRAELHVHHAAAVDDDGVARVK